MPQTNESYRIREVISIPHGAINRYNGNKAHREKIKYEDWILVDYLRFATAYLEEFEGEFGETARWYKTSMARIQAELPLLEDYSESGIMYRLNRCVDLGLIKMKTVSGHYTLYRILPLVAQIESSPIKKTTADAGTPPPLPVAPPPTPTACVLPAVVSPEKTEELEPQRDPNHPEWERRATALLNQAPWVSQGENAVFLKDAAKAPDWMRFAMYLEQIADIHTFKNVKFPHKLVESKPFKNNISPFNMPSGFRYSWQIEAEQQAKAQELRERVNSAPVVPAAPVENPQKETFLMMLAEMDSETVEAWIEKAVEKLDNFMKRQYVRNGLESLAVKNTIENILFQMSQTGELAV